MFKLLWCSWKEGAVESHLYAVIQRELSASKEFHGWGVTDKGNRLDFYFHLIKYILNYIKYFKGLVFAGAFLIQE